MEVEVVYIEKLQDRMEKVTRLKRAITDAVDNDDFDEVIAAAEKIKTVKLMKIERQAPGAPGPVAAGHIKKNLVCVNFSSDMCDGEPSKGKQRMKWKQNHYEQTLIKKLPLKLIISHGVVMKTSSLAVKTSILNELAETTDDEWNRLRPNYPDVMCPSCFERFLEPFYKK